MMVIKECWDTCLFLSFLNNDVAEREKVDTVEALIRQASQPKSDRMIVVSTIVIAEVQPRDKYNKEHWDVVRELFFTARHYIKRQALTPKIAEIASHLRAKYKMGLADAINVATASLEPCSVLYTFDGSGDRPRPNDILPLDGIIASPGLPPLHIAVPTMPPDSQLPYFH